MKQEDTEWVITDNISEYLKAFVWLTTMPMNLIPVDNGKMLNGLANPICRFEFFIPDKPKEKILSSFWSNYTWICRSFIHFMEIGEKCYHFKMSSLNEYPYPPIPARLYDLYKTRGPKGGKQ